MSCEAAGSFPITTSDTHWNLAADPAALRDVAATIRERVADADRVAALLRAATDVLDHAAAVLVYGTVALAREWRRSSSTTELTGRAAGRPQWRPGRHVTTGGRGGPSAVYPVVEIVLPPLPPMTVGTNDVALAWPDSVPRMWSPHYLASEPDWRTTRTTVAQQRHNSGPR